MTRQEIEAKRALLGSLKSTMAAASDEADAKALDGIPVILTQEEANLIEYAIKAADISLVNADKMLEEHIL